MFFLKTSIRNKYIAGYLMAGGENFSPPFLLNQQGIFNTPVSSSDTSRW